MKTRLAIACLLLVTIPVVTGMLSCRKDKNRITVRGSVFDPNTGVHVTDALVTISANKITSGLYNSGFEEISRMQTADDGGFEFVFPEEKVGSYRISIAKPGYFQYYKEISVTEINPETAYFSVFNFYPIGYVKVLLKNTTPFSSGDAVSWYFSSGYVNCSDCCDNSIRTLTGMDVDMEFLCRTYGNQDVALSWFVTKNNLTVLHSGSLYCTAGDTTLFHLYY
jgi:hypothetical protein